MEFFASEVLRPGRLHLSAPSWVHRWPDFIQVGKTVWNVQFRPVRDGYETVKRPYYFMMDDAWHSTVLTVTLTGLRIQPGYKAPDTPGPRAFWKVTDYVYWTGWSRSTGLHGERIEGELRPRFRVPSVQAINLAETCVQIRGDASGN